MEPGIPYDEKRGLIPNEVGKIDSHPGLFCAGWLATGPRGVIVNTMTEAFRVGQTVLENLPELLTQSKNGYGTIEKLFSQRNVKPVTFKDWEKIDAKEKELGKLSGKPREKLTDIGQIISATKLHDKITKIGKLKVSKRTSEVE